MKTVNLKEKFEAFNDYWSPKVVADLNNHQVKCAKFKGEFVWHQHDVDELFLVQKGSIEVLFENQLSQQVREGEMLVIPKGVRHCPVAAKEAHVVIIEPSHVVNTGEVVNEHTVKKLPRI